MLNNVTSYARSRGASRIKASATLTRYLSTYLESGHSYLDKLVLDSYQRLTVSGQRDRWCDV